MATMGKAFHLGAALAAVIMLVAQSPASAQKTTCAQEKASCLKNGGSPTICQERYNNCMRAKKR
jgi:hypothetical protein